MSREPPRPRGCRSPRSRIRRRSALSPAAARALAGNARASRGGERERLRDKPRLHVLHRAAWPLRVYALLARFLAALDRRSFLSGATKSRFGSSNRRGPKMARSAALAPAPSLTPAPAGLHSCLDGSRKRRRRCGAESRAGVPRFPGARSPRARTRSGSEVPPRHLAGNPARVPQRHGRSAHGSRGHDSGLPHRRDACPAELSIRGQPHRVRQQNLPSGERWLARRRSVARVRHLQLLEDLHDQAPVAEPAVGEIERAEVMRDLIRRLRPIQAETLVLRAVLGFSMEEIAAADRSLRQHGQDAPPSGQERTSPARRVAGGSSAKEA